VAVVVQMGRLMMGGGVFGWGRARSYGLLCREMNERVRPASERKLLCFESRYGSEESTCVLSESWMRVGLI